MDSEALIRWALDDARSLEERYTVELLTEEVQNRWHWKHKTGQYQHWRLGMERKRQRRLNPAYEPSYTEEQLRRAVEIWPELTEISLRMSSYDSRPVRNLAVLRFFTWIEKMEINGEGLDCEIFAELPRLRHLGFSSPGCEDYRPLGRCTQLQSLGLSLATHWPEVAGLERLQQLTSLSLSGNLLALPPDTAYPRVKSANISCSPLYARDVRQLPQLPACEILTLAGVERLDGIEAWPRLRNLTLNGKVRSFAPLTALRELTGLVHTGDYPLDVEPLARVPGLRYLSLRTDHVYNTNKAPLRDLSPLLGAPKLQEVSLSGCPPLELEVAAINAALPPWNEEFLLPEARPLLTPLRMIVSPPGRQPRRASPLREPGDPELIDSMMRGCEERWVQRWVAGLIAERIGFAEWGDVRASGDDRSFCVTVECYEIVERFAEIVEVTRGALARLRAEYCAYLVVSLKAPPPEPTEEQRELMRRFREEQDQADFERRRAEEAEALERQYLLQLKKQAGEKIDPKEFAAPPPEPLPPAPWEKDEAEDEEDDDKEGGVAEKKKPAPPPDLWDDEHPLADNYRLWVTLHLDSIWIPSHQRDIAVHLLRREPDQEIPEDPPA